MRGLWPLLIPTFALGFGVAWWSKPDPPPVEVEVARPKVTPRAPGADSGLRETVITHETTLNALGDLRFGSGFDEELEAIDPSEIPALLAALADRAGYYGLGYEDEEVLEQLLLRWYAADPDAALVWTLGVKTTGDRRQLLNQLVRHEAENDLDRAIDLARRYARDEDGDISLPDVLMEQAVDEGADKLLEVCRLGVSDADGTRGIPVDYPSGFPFRDTLEAIADLAASLEDGQSLSMVPSNLLAEWARRDPEAAYAWLASGRKVPFNGEVGDFVEGYAEVATNAEVGAFAAGLFDPDERPARRYDTAFDILSEVPEGETLEGFLEGLADPGAREQHLEGLFLRSQSAYGGGYDRAREQVLLAMAPEMRVRLMSQSTLTASKRRELVPLLRRLGHSEEEIAAMTGGG